MAGKSTLTDSKRARERFFDAPSMPDSLPNCTRRQPLGHSPLGDRFPLSVPFDDPGRSLEPLAKRLGQDAINGPPEADSILDETAVDPKSVCPFRHTERFVVVGQKRLAPAIARLLLSCRPSAVVRLVVAVVVDAFDLVFFGRSLPHVGKECLERLPAVAHPDASALVVPVSRSTKCLASVEHRPPGFVCRGPMHPVCLAAAGRCFTIETTATAFCAEAQVTPVCKRGAAAIAVASPHKQFTDIPPREFPDDEAKESLPCDIRRVLVKLGRVRWLGGVNGCLNVLRHGDLLEGKLPQLIYHDAQRESI
jgi:hypothetical protein